MRCTTTHATPTLVVECEYVKRTYKDLQYILEQPLGLVLVQNGKEESLHIFGRTCFVFIVIVAALIRQNVIGLKKKLEISEFAVLLSIYC